MCLKAGIAWFHYNYRQKLQYLLKSIGLNGSSSGGHGIHTIFVYWSLITEEIYAAHIDPMERNVRNKLKTLSH